MQGTTPELKYFCNFSGRQPRKWVTSGQKTKKKECLGETGGTGETEERDYSLDLSLDLYLSGSDPSQRDNHFDY